MVAVVADVKSGTAAPWDRPNLREWVACGCDWCRTEDKAAGRKRPKYKPERMTEFDAILAWRNDRLSRGAWNDEVKIRQWAEVHNKTLIIKDGPQWPPRLNSDDKWAWESMADQARREWEDMQQRTLVSLAELKSRGKFVGRVPFGYDPVGEKYDRRLVPNETGRKYVHEIFRRVIDGESLATIAKWLTDEGVPTNQANGSLGNGWWPRVIHRMVQNTTYTGFHCMEYTDPDTDARLVGVHRCEPLLTDPGMFKRANDALATRGKRGAANKNGDAMLKGAITCPNCPDTPMYRHRCLHNGKGKTPFYYYRCAGRGSQRKSCSLMVRMELVDSAVDRIMHDTFDIPVMKKIVVHGHDHRQELEAAKHELRMLAALDLPDDEYDTRLAELRSERDRIDRLPVVPDHVELVATGESYAELWAALGPSERGPWLTEHEFHVTADKGLVTVTQGDVLASWDLSVPVALAA